MSTTTTTLTVTADNGTKITELINRLAGLAATTGDSGLLVNGREVWTRIPGRTPAQHWQNGTVSVLVRGRKSGTQGETFAKVGETLTLTNPSPIFREGEGA